MSIPAEKRKQFRMQWLVAKCTSGKSFWWKEIAQNDLKINSKSSLMHSVNPLEDATMHFGNNWKLFVESSVHWIPNTQTQMSHRMGNSASDELFPDISEATSFGGESKFCKFPASLLFKAIRQWFIASHSPHSQRNSTREQNKLAKFTKILLLCLSVCVCVCVGRAEGRRQETLRWRARVCVNCTFMSMHIKHI